MLTLNFTDTHNMVAFLSKPTKSDGFEQIVDFLNANPIRWQGIVITESSVRRDLQLADEEVTCLSRWQGIVITESSVRRDLQLADEEDDAVHKELGDRLVKDTNTASSLEAEQDNGNITKTKSKATPNESSSQGTNLGGGPRCQEPIGDTTAQTRFESVSKHSNDSLVARGNTLQSDEDKMKLDELMKLCTTLQNMVLDLEQTNTTQRNEIDSLKRSVESSSNEESLGKDASKKGRRIDADENIALINDADNEMFDVDALGGEEMFVVGQNENVVKEIVDAAQVSTAATTVTITTEEINLAQALKALETLKPKDKGKGIMIEEPAKPKKKDQIRLNEEAAEKLQAKFDAEERRVREKVEKEKRANIALSEE
nr:hypothetical protein [Tanacetum cinerariifolium]